MRKIIFIFLGFVLCTNAFCAAVRSPNTTVRSTPESTNSRQTTSRSKQSTTNRSTVSRATLTNTNTKKNRVIRTATKKVSARSMPTKTAISRSAIPTKQKRVARAATNTSISTRTFGTNYETCRDAYFTCMDQFCANQNEDYRRCVCSSRLQDIQNKENLLSQTATSLQDFKDFNIDAISKTASEVKAMQTATEGEATIKKDDSNSSKTLNNIKRVLNISKQKALSSQGTMDIAGDIKSIWKTTDLIRGHDIATLSGEALYNAVHAQCSAMVTEQCAESDLKMVASAYGMYIENDCELLATNLKSKTTNANVAIRSTRHEMQDARLENYDAHNTLAINDCISRIRQDILADTACGENYVHCLDITGLYLNATTGEPIYSPKFYKMANQLSLSGDVLKNSANTAFINMLNKKQSFAQKDLDLCRDISPDVWDEFLRQALVEIYQGQQTRVKQVKTECLKVVNECYLKKVNELKSLSDGESSFSTRQALELSEEVCATKLDSCSNLYGGGPEGLSLLVATMNKITDETIAQECPALLQAFVEKICSVPASDSSHVYPYGCRTYSPGEPRYANKDECNSILDNPFASSNILITNITQPDELYYAISEEEIEPGYTRKYNSCAINYYLYDTTSCPEDNNEPIASYMTENPAPNCCPCPSTYSCNGGTSKPIKLSKDGIEYSCGTSYVGSVYQKLVRYAVQNCTRTTQQNYILPATILAEVDKTMNSLRATLIQEVSKECYKLNGIWVDIQWKDKNYDGYHDDTGDTLLEIFYTTTATNRLWGYCKPQ